jgi:hypothetical protein
MLVSSESEAEKALTYPDDEVSDVFLEDLTALEYIF